MKWKCRLTVWSPLWDPHACRTRPGTSNGKTAGRMSCRKATSSCRRLHSSRRRWAAPRRPEWRGHRCMEECEPVKPSTLEIQTSQVCYYRYGQVAPAQSFLLLQSGWGGGSMLHQWAMAEPPRGEWCLCSPSGLPPSWARGPPGWGSRPQLAWRGGWSSLLSSAGPWRRLSRESPSDPPPTWPRPRGSCPRGSGRRRGCPSSCQSRSYCWRPCRRTPSSIAPWSPGADFWPPCPDHVDKNTHWLRCHKICFDWKRMRILECLGLVCGHTHLSVQVCEFHVDEATWQTSKTQVWAETCWTGQQGAGVCLRIFWVCLPCLFKQTAC